MMHDSKQKKKSYSLYAAFAMVLISGVHHAYTIRYSNRKNPAPNKEKLYSLAMVHFISVAVYFM